MKTEFCVVSSSYKHQFIEEVQKHLNEGWEFHGTMLIAEHFTLVQAMVRKTP